MDNSKGVLPGTLDLLILKAVSLGTLHGYGVCSAFSRFPAVRCRFSRVRCIRRCTAQRQGLIDSEWGASDNNRRAKFYRLTRTGRARLAMRRRAGIGSLTR